MLHAITGPGGQAQYLLHPARDMGHCFPTVLRQACRLAGVPWSAMMRVLGACGASTGDVHKGIAALAKFVEMQPDGLEPDSKSRDMNASIKASGFGDVSAAGQLVALALVGRVCLSYFWQGVRDVSEGVQPPAKYAALWEAVQKAGPLLAGQNASASPALGEGEG